MNQSVYISGMGVMVMLIAPAACAPWRLDASLRSVRAAEQRSPASWPHIDGPRAVISGKTWAGVNSAVNDRIPFRGCLMGWKWEAEVSVLEARAMGKVGVGEDVRLFFLPELGELAGTPDQRTPGTGDRRSRDADR